MKNVLLLVHDDAGQESRFQVALDLTRALEGHLTCLDVSIFPVIFSDIYATTVETPVFDDERVREAKNRERLEGRLGREGVSWSWIDAFGSPALRLKEQAALSDIIVVSRRLDSDTLPDTRAIASEVVIESGKAVVAVPEFARGFEVAGHSMIAWDGSAEAIKALQAAVPLLKLARTVSIAEIDDGSVGQPAEEAAAYLSRHGISAVIVRRRGKSLPAADVLLAEAKAEGADYIVMGGFGCSRFIEAVFGGVSRAMLNDSPIPVVMSH